MSILHFFAEGSGYTKNILNILFADVPRDKISVVLFWQIELRIRFTSFRDDNGNNFVTDKCKNFKLFFFGMQSKLLCIFMLLSLVMRQSLHSSDAKCMYA